MVRTPLHRRAFLAGAVSVGALPNWARANDYVDLEWTDLLPLGETQLPPELNNLIDHSQAPVANAQPQSSGVRSDWNGQVVRLPGFIVPIEYSGTGVTAFILVPFVGACVHVPPPPANQLVFVTSETPFESGGLYEPVNVIGMFGVSAISTHLADVGYALSADRIEPF